MHTYTQEVSMLLLVSIVGSLFSLSLPLVALAVGRPTVTVSRPDSPRAPFSGTDDEGTINNETNGTANTGGNTGQGGSGGEGNGAATVETGDESVNVQVTNTVNNNPVGSFQFGGVGAGNGGNGGTSSPG